MEIESLLEDPFLLKQTFLSLVEAEKKETIAAILDLDGEAKLSLWFDASLCQDSFRFRVQRRSIRIASYLLDEEGKWKIEALEAFVFAWKQRGHIFYPDGTNDAVFHRHVLKVLERFLQEESLRKEILRFQKPLCHSWAEQIICYTLGLPPGTVLTDTHIRIAAVSACLSLLRQNVGSCFATAPAIVIQNEQIENLLADLYELLTTGKLKKVIAGVEMSVPMSPKLGHGDLQKNMYALCLKGPLWFSPGIISALEAIGLLEKEASFQEKASRVKELLLPLIQENATWSIEEGLSQLLLRQYNVRKEEVERFQKEQIQFAKRGHFLVSPSLEFSRCEQYLTAEKTVFAVLKAQVDHLLLKVWEFTLASFSEVKMDFSRWNMYASLGLDPKESGGIGEVLVQLLQGKVEKSNEKLQEYQTDYEIAYDQLRSVEIRLKRASSEEEGRRLQVEFQMRLQHMQACLERRDAFYKKATHYTNLFSFLVEQFDRRFPEYFQEIYDAEMLDVKADLYEDSPAGFRLVYKHGRADASLWTMIRSREEYVDALGAFFHIIESQVAAECDWEGALEDIQEIFSLVILHIRTDLFLISALQRMAKAHRIPIAENPLDSLESMEKKPWAYTSGGSMQALLKHYYRREGDLLEETRWIESEMDLFVFLLDALKSVPFYVEQRFLKDPSKALLMRSPSHAFLLLPGLPEFARGWEDNGFSYTWIRDHVLLPCKEFYAKMLLSPKEQAFLIQELFASNMQIPLIDKDRSPKEFRNWLCSLNPKDANLFLFEDKIDSFLCQSLPLISSEDWKEKALSLLSPYVSFDFESFLGLQEDPLFPFLTQTMFKKLVKRLYIAFHRKIVLGFDLHQEIAKRARELSLAPPSPVLFADTNWNHYYFGFTVNPGTENLELWRWNHSAEEGISMRPWKHWLDGSTKDTWSIFINPAQYSLLFNLGGKNYLKKL